MTLKKDVQKVAIKGHEGPKRPCPSPSTAPGQAFESWIDLSWGYDYSRHHGHYEWDSRVRIYQMFCILIPAIKLIRSKLAFTYP